MRKVFKILEHLPQCIFFQVERLVDRASSSTLLDDRRDAVRALKALSKVCFISFSQTVTCYLIPGTCS